jgi:4-amino-4-deoxy-L-arabinose transferase-like glycosyltransferase
LNGAAAARAAISPWFWLLLGLCWLGASALRPLTEPDEARYSEIPREMWVSGDWVTPHLNGVRYFEKPPLHYWATAAAYSLFGFSEFSARAFALGLAFLCVPLVYAFVRRAGGAAAEENACAAAVALAVNPIFTILAGIDILDSSFSFLLTCTLFACVQAQQAAPGSARARGSALAMWAALGLAVLAKGIAAPVLCGATLVAYTIVTRSFAPWKRMHWLPGLTLFALIVLPWFVLVAQRNPAFLQFFFVHEHFERFLTQVHRRVEPWWFFLPFLAFGLLPWLRSLPAAWRAARPGAGTAGAAFNVTAFLLAWCGVVTLFFSASQSKLVPYVMPVFPVLAAALAPFIAARPGWLRLAAGWLGGFLLIAAIAMTGYAAQSEAGITAAMLGWTLVALVAALAAVLIAARHGFWPVVATGTARSSGVLIAAAMLGICALITAYTCIATHRTAKALVTAVRPMIAPDARLYSVGQYRQSVPPYLGRTLQMVAYRNELDFGLAQQVPDGELSLEQFLERWQHEAGAVAFVDPGIYRDNAARLLGRVLGSDRGTIVVQR